MSALTETRIRQAAKMYEFRDRVLKMAATSPETYHTVENILNAYSKKHNKGLLESAISLASDREGIEVIWLLGVATILIEQ